MPTAFIFDVKKNNYIRMAEYDFVCKCLQINKYSQY